VSSVRGFLLGGSVQPKLSLAHHQSLGTSDNRKGEWMTGGELATLVERLVPRLNDIDGAARYCRCCLHTDFCAPMGDLPHSFA
jgi:hypothetical protein